MAEEQGAFEFGDVVAAWFRAVAALVVFAVIAISTGWKLLAAEPELPFLQDGSARTAFVSGAYKTCLERQRDFPENTSFTAPELGQYCLCYGRALADIVNAREYEAITVGGPSRAPATLLQKTALSANLCHAKMQPEAQDTDRERDIVTVKNECSKTYFPEDTDFAASVVHEWLSIPGRNASIPA